MRSSADMSSEPTVVVIGPPPERIGGMASVVAQMLAMDCCGRYRLELLPITLASDACETLCGRIVRHIRQGGFLRATVRRTRAPIVHIHTCSGFSFYRSAADMLLARQYGCRVILHLHGGRFHAFYAGEPSCRRKLIVWSLCRADRVITLSPGCREKLREMAPSARLVVVENAVELPRASATARQDGPCRFVLLAQMEEWKGIDDLLCACAQLRDQGNAMNLALAGPPGTAGDASVLNQKIRSHGLETVVRYVGPVRGGEKAKLLRWADVYVQPSRYEGMPIALLEALAYGLPVVATRVGAVSEVIEDRRHGLLVPPRRPDLLARAMCALASNGRLRRVMSHAARSLAEKRFSVDRFRTDLLTLYDSVNPLPRRVPLGMVPMTAAYRRCLPFTQGPRPQLRC